VLVSVPKYKHKTPVTRLGREETCCDPVERKCEPGELDLHLSSWEQLFVCYGPLPF
jgi:hypothetical protein